MEHNIGDAVMVKDYDQLPEQLKKKAIGRLCGKRAVVVDKLWSDAKECTLYKLRIDGKDNPSTVEFPTQALERVDSVKQYQYEFSYLDNVVVAVLNEVGDGYIREVARGHGHIIHDGVEGVAQAASYALKRIYLKVAEQRTL